MSCPARPKEPRTPKMRELRRRIAWHEAGHAVAAIAVGATLVEVHVARFGHAEEDDPNLGGIYFQLNDAEQEPAETLLRGGFACLCGPAAERLRPPSPTWATVLSRAVDDANNAREFIQHVGRKRALDLASNFVVFHKPTIQALAVVLIREDLVTGTRAAQIIRKADRALARSLHPIDALLAGMDGVV